ncbi:chromate transporter [Candidatus Oleimmundimicrobium sp.]|uniref:chromate transporter n=1 Tax=Candidatus Oleimmundimicrobium sp. TaxID=3060597 RepID=UPI00271E8539|nr:chromate transporter [Candidatus Oleimmundimicrobium sp.]MDO8886246.1 chromate transporter [Candidatus Oleimmundimicrobium sp.]
MPTGKQKLRKKLKIMATAISLVLIVLGFSAPLLAKLNFTFLKIGTIAFGNGYTIIPFIQKEVVEGYNWLTPAQFAAAIIFAQVTPGPVIILATFVGFLVAGIPGAFFATISMLLPSAFLIIILAKQHKRVKNLKSLQAFFGGVVASVIGMLAAIALNFSKINLVDIKTGSIFGGSLIALACFDVEPIYVVFVSCIISLFLF